MSILRDAFFLWAAAAKVQHVRARLAEIDLCYDRIKMALPDRIHHDGDTAFRQLEHRQMRERLRFEDEY